jgi:hypothetical protein
MIVNTWVYSYYASVLSVAWYSEKQQTVSETTTLSLSLSLSLSLHMKQFVVTAGADPVPEQLFFRISDA